jgi:PAS domain S-box-containing protein
MKNAIPFHPNDEKRLDALQSYAIIDSPGDKDFDDLATMASILCQMPVAFISFIDSKREWFKFHKGFHVSEIPLSQSPGIRTLFEINDITIIPDLKTDKSFKDIPIFTSQPYLSYYVGVPLLNKDGYLLGTLGLLGDENTKLSEEQKGALKILSNSVMDKLELRRQTISQQDIKIAAIEQETGNTISFSAQTIIEQSPIPVIIFRGEDLIIEAVNQPMLTMLGKKDDILNKPLLQAMPELSGQHAYDLLWQVYSTGEPFNGSETPVTLIRNGVIETHYYNFSYTPLVEDGKVAGVIDIAVEVTEQVKVNQIISQLNEDLLNANRHLTASYEDLDKARIMQDRLIFQLSQSELKTRLLISDAPVGICVLTGRDMIVETVNDMMLGLWGKTRIITGLPIKAVLPELEGNSFFQQLDEVYTTGEPYFGTDVQIFLEHNGALIEGYYSFVYQPIRDHLGHTESIMIVASDVTDQVIARKQIEQAEAKLRLAVDAGELGTWYINLENQEFIPSQKLKLLFGYYADEEMPFDMSGNYIPEAYRGKVLELIDNAVKNDETFYAEYPIIGVHDQKLRWVRAVGKSYEATAGKPAHFSGSIIEITGRREDEQRKNDFLGMVSHELKTPLTSMFGYLQMLGMKARKNGDDQAIKILERAEKQAVKMTSMINSFLDVSRMESGRLSVHKERFDMADLVKEAEDETLSTIATHKVVFAPVETTIVYADQDKIGQVITNLISNAVKYSDPGTTINVACIKMDGMVQVSVRDEGLGISPKDQKKLFDRYFRVESKQIDQIVGFGIGLYLCAEIVHLHNGKIWVESEPHAGSTFYFSLPLET